MISKSFKNILLILNILLTSFLTIGCNTQDDEKIMKRLDWWFQQECRRVSTVYLPITNYEDVYLPTDFYYIDDETDKEYDLTISWSSSSDMISFVYEKPTKDYTLFSNKTYGHNSYRIKINNVPINREYVEITGDTSYRGVKYSKSFKILIGDKGDNYIHNQKYWFPMYENQLKYLYDGSYSSDFSQNHYVTKILEKDIYDIDDKTYTHYYSNTTQNTYTENYTNKIIYSIIYNCETKEIEYSSNKINIANKFNAADYINYKSFINDFDNSNFFDRIKVLDQYFIITEQQELVSPFYKNNLYSYNSIFGNSESE